jgi:hypothetical protein
LKTDAPSKIHEKMKSHQYFRKDNQNPHRDSDGNIKQMYVKCNEYDEHAEKISYNNIKDNLYCPYDMV